MSIVGCTPFRTLMFVASAPLVLAGCGIDNLFDDGARRTETETVPVEAVGSLDVVTDNGAVEIRSAGVDEITVESVLHEKRDGDADSTVTVIDDRLVVRGECKARWWDNCSVGFVVTVPSDLDVRVVTGSGRVTVSDVDGDVDLTSDNGAIDASGLGAATVVSESGNGRIELVFDEVPTSVTTRTGNGAISVRIPDDDSPYVVDVESDNGAVEVGVRTDPAADRRLTARSGNGAIEVGYLRT